MRRLILSLAFLAHLVACGAEEDAAPPPTTSVNELMMTVITPATNTLWAAEDPSTDAEWQALADAAALVIDATASIRLGGSGPNDMQWSADPAWQAFADDLDQAANDAYAAASKRDLDALFLANDVLYPPCEECHVQFHPGVSEDGAD